MDFCRRNSGVFGVRVGSTKPDDAITDFEGVMFSRTCRDYGPFCLITKYPGVSERDKDRSDNICILSVDAADKEGYRLRVDIIDANKVVPYEDLTLFWSWDREVGLVLQDFNTSILFNLNAFHSCRN
jgi:hypothetical protein